MIFHGHHRNGLRMTLARNQGQQKNRYGDHRSRAFWRSRAPFGAWTDTTRAATKCSASTTKPPSTSTRLATYQRSGMTYGGGATPFIGHRRMAAFTTGGSAGSDDRHWGRRANRPRDAANATGVRERPQGPRCSGGDCGRLQLSAGQAWFQGRSASARPSRGRTCHKHDGRRPIPCLKGAGYGVEG